VHRDQLQSNQDFQDGLFDLDALCGELRAAARCSECGILVQHDALQKVLKKLEVGRKQADNNLQSPAAEG
jgi:hypothetical protein